MPDEVGSMTTNNPPDEVHRAENEREQVSETKSDFELQHEKEWMALKRIDKNNIPFYDICRVSASCPTYTITVPLKGIDNAEKIAGDIRDMLNEKH